MKLIIRMGYIFNLETQKYQHREVYEQYLGRALKNDETVHHKDNNPRNNNIDNLFLFPTRRDHTLYHWHLKRHGYISEENFLKNQLQYKEIQ